jgi:hypothetical protein
MADVPDWILWIVIASPFVLVTLMTIQVSKRMKQLQTLQREICLREIESAGGFEAWKRQHFSATSSQSHRGT